MKIEIYQVSGSAAFSRKASARGPKVMRRVPDAPNFSANSFLIEVDVCSTARTKQTLVIPQPVYIPRHDGAAFRAPNCVVILLAVGIGHRTPAHQ